MVSLSRDTKFSSSGEDARLGNSGPGPAHSTTERPPVTSEQMLEVLDDYKAKGRTAVAVLSELNDLLGPTFMPKLVSAASAFALYRDPSATQYQSPPLPFVFKFLPQSFVSKMDMIADFINFGVQVNLIPRTKIEQLASDPVNAELFVNLIKESIK